MTQGRQVGHRCDRGVLSPLPGGPQPRQPLLPDVDRGGSFIRGFCANRHSGGPNDCNVNGPPVHRCVRLRPGRIYPATHLRPVERAQPRSIERNPQASRRVACTPIPGIRVRSASATAATCSSPENARTARPCRVHIALHGCLQDAGEIDRRFINEAGYNAWADSNRLIVLYPQTAVSWYLPYNPLACWDLWGYADQKRQLCHQVRIADQDHQGHARRADRARHAGDRSGAGSGCGAAGADARRHLGHVSGSGVVAACGSHGLPGLARRRRWSSSRRWQKPQAPCFADSDLSSANPPIAGASRPSSAGSRVRPPSRSPPPPGPLHPHAPSQAIVRSTSDRSFA